MTEATKQGEIHIEYMALDEILSWPKNPKLHEVEQIEASMHRFGFTQPVMIDETSQRLVAGHGRIQTLQKIRDAGGEVPDRVKVDDDGTWRVPVLRGIGFENEDEGAAYVVADNRLSELGGWDDTLLGEILANLKEQDMLDGIGYNPREIDSLLATINPVREVGRTPEEKLDTYLDAEIKQIVLYFDADQYESVLDRLHQVMDLEGVDNHTEAIVKLLDHYLDGDAEDEAAAS